MTMNNNAIGLYIHLPFCIRKCGYCDFCSLPSVSEEAMASYVAALRKEMAHYAPLVKDKRVDTLFFGGGTPTLLPLSLMQELFSDIYRLFSVDKDAEITVEANPASADREKLAGLCALGVNRLSIGVQSLSDGELALLGRVHSAKDALDFYADARAVGFSSINLDLMYAIPSQTAESFKETLQTALSLAPEHLSVYSLIVEEGTPFYEKGASLSLPDEEEEEAMRLLLLRETDNAGYERYEISNFAKNGYACRHNLHYWRNEEYLGFGLAAYSYFGGVRYGNGRDMQAYLQAPTGVVSEREVLSAEDKAYEYVMTRLRLREGFSLAEYRCRFGVDFMEQNGAQASEYLAADLMKNENGRIFLTDKGMNLSNSILVSFLP